jgi:outer membrane protein TolC
LLLALGAPAVAAAQPATPPPATAPITLPPPPSVDDPMLAAAPPATRNIASWEQALQFVRSRSTDLRSAYAQVTQAEADSRTALAGALPSLNATGSATHNFLVKETSSNIIGSSISGTNVSPARNLFNGSLTLDQALFAPRTWYAVGTAHKNEDLARMSVEDVKRQIAQSVANALITVVTTERIAELNRVGFRSALERLEITNRKKALGAATGLDVVRARQDVETARAPLVSGDEDLRKAREALGLALGFSEPIGVDRAISLDGIEKSAQTACHPAKSIDERADIAAAHAQVTVAERGIGDAKYRYSPTVSARSTLNYQSLASDFTANPTWNIQAILTIPIFDGGARYGATRSAEAATDQAEQKLVGLRRQAEIQVAQARRAVTVADAARKVAADARQIAAETDRLTQAGYLEGQGTSLELVTAAAALRQAEVSLAIREFDVVKARVSALLALANCPF